MQRKKGFFGSEFQNFLRIEFFILARNQLNVIQIG